MCEGVIVCAGLKMYIEMILCVGMPVLRGDNVKGWLCV